MSWRRLCFPVLVVLLVAGAAALAHGRPVLRNLPRHHWEDFRFLRHDRNHIGSVMDCFTKASAWPGLYRPLSTNLYYHLGRRLWGGRIEAYHVLNAGLFLLNGLLLFGLSSLLLPRPWSALPPLLFVSRLAHVQVATRTSEFQALSSTGLALAALYALVLAWRRESRGLEAVGLAGFALALLCKEAVVMIAPMVTVHALLFEPRHVWRRSLGAWFVAGAWALLFMNVFRPWIGEQPTGFASDPAGAAFRATVWWLVFANGLVRGLPIETAMAPRAIELGGQPWATGLFFALLAAEVIGLWLVRRLADRVALGLKVALFGFAWFLLGVAPYAVLLDRLFMRYSYFPHVGLALAASGLALAGFETVSRLLGKKDGRDGGREPPLP